MLLGGHEQSYSGDTVAFALSLLTFVPLGVLIVASAIAEPLRARAAARTRDDRFRKP